MVQILDQIPHRYPFLMLDKIVEIDIDKRIVALKNLTANDPIFQGHFPDHPVMPGSLLLESMSQAATALLLSRKDLSGRIGYFSSVEKLVFKQAVYPGDQLRIEITVKEIKNQIAKFKGIILVDGAIVCEGSFGFSLSLVPSKSKIHSTASVHPSAILGKDVVVGPYSIISEHVFIGDKTEIGAHVMIDKWTRIGDENMIYFGCVIGGKPQDIKYEGEETWVVIGDRNEIREYVTISRATGKKSVTRVGSDNMLLSNVHIGHNCQIGNQITMANMVHLGGHVTIDDCSVIGGLTGIHQFVRVGRETMVGGYSKLVQDIPPLYVM